MRLAILATPALLPDQRPAPGALDGDILHARLPLHDTAFDVHNLDPTIDVAQQLEELFDLVQPGSDDAVLFYASCPVVLTATGEIFLCLDPKDPDTGDALEDIAAVFRERITGSSMFVLECRHRAVANDPFASANVAAAVRTLLGSVGSGTELLVAASPLVDETVDASGAFTRALVASLDDVEPGRALTAADLYRQLHDSEALLGVVPSFAYGRGRAPFFFIRGEPAEPAGAGDWAARPAAAAPSDQAGGPTEGERLRGGEPDGALLDADDRGAGDDHAEADDLPRISVHDLRPAYDDDLDEFDVVEDEAQEARSDAGGAESHVRASVPPTPLPDDRSFTKPIEDLPRVIVSDRPSSLAAPAPEHAPKAASENVEAASAPAAAEVEPEPAAHEVAGAAIEAFEVPNAVVEAAPRSMPRSPGSERPSAAPGAQVGAQPTAGEQPRPQGAADGDPEATLKELRAALGLLGAGARGERASIYVRMAECKRRQGKRREAISNLEKALGIVATERSALEALIELDFEERDKRGLMEAEERLLALVGESERAGLLLRWGARWYDELADSERARALFERARASAPAARVAHEYLARICQADGDVEASFAARRSVADLTEDGAERARLYCELGKDLLRERGPEDGVLALFDLALDADPQQLAPLELVSAVLAERMEYGELERAYRRMLDRIHRTPHGIMRTEVSLELCRRLGMLFRDHLEDPELALDAFEDALDVKPGDLPTLLAAAEIARDLGRHDTAALHLQVAARVDPSRVATFHELFELFQRTRRPDLAYCAACVTSFAGASDPRERVVFDEHKPQTVPKLSRALRPEAWELLRATHDEHVEAIFAAVAPAAIAARLAALAEAGRLPVLDPALRQDPESATASIVRSFTWASHFLGVPAPAVYVRDDATLALAAVAAQEPVVIAGGAVLRGRSLVDLGFLVGRHLAYHVTPNRLLLFYPSLEDLSACFVAAVKIALAGVPVPRAIEGAVSALLPAIDAQLGAAPRAALVRAAASFEATGARADLAAWVASVERCATRAGFLLAESLPVAERITAADPRGVLSTEEKMSDLCGWVVSDAYHLLREELGIAVQP